MHWLVTLLVLAGCGKAARKVDDAAVPVALDAVPVDAQIDAVEEIDKQDRPRCAIKACERGEDCKFFACRCDDGTTPSMRRATIIAAQPRRRRARARASSHAESLVAVAARQARATRA